MREWRNGRRTRLRIHVESFVNKPFVLYSMRGFSVFVTHQTSYFAWKGCQRMEINQAKQIFMVSRRAARLSRRTILWYDVLLDGFINHIAKSGIDKTELITKPVIQEYLCDLGDRMRAITVQGHFRAIRAFFNFLFDEEYIDRNPMKKISKPKAEHKIMRTFTKQEIEKILKNYNQSDFFGLRNYLIMCMLFSTGIRQGELLSLKEKDVNLLGDVMKINGKGSRERVVPIGKALHRVMNRYITWRSDYLKGERCEFFFINKDRQGMKKSAISTVFYILKKNLKMQGERFSTHTMRHTFAKTFLLNGGDVFSLQRLLGHSDITVTRQYIHLNDKELKIQAAKYNPLDNLEWQF